MRMQHMMSSQKLVLSILMSGLVTFFILLIRPLHFQGYRPQSTDEFWNVELLILSYHARLLGSNTLQRQCISRSTNWSVDFLMVTFATSSCNAVVVDIYIERNDCEREIEEDEEFGIHVVFMRETDIRRIFCNKRNSLLRTTSNQATLSVFSC